MNRMISVKEYFRLEKQLSSAQGMAIYDEYLFQLYHTGYCAVHNIKEKNLVPNAFFPLGSANEGCPNCNYTNHANQCMFSTIRCKGNDLPLMYVTTGNGTGYDDEGFFYRCCVENILLDRDYSRKVISGHSELLQTISYKNEGIEETSYESPCWGCPAWLVDSENGYLYMFSCRNRTTIEFADMMDSNAYIISKFLLPDPLSKTRVTLNAFDIVDQFTCPFDTLFTQGGIYANGKIYYTFGMGNDKRGCYPDRLKVFDLEKRMCVNTIDLSDSLLGKEEIECCGFYNGDIFVNTNAGTVGIYSLGNACE